jgi:hypothetical protein
VLTHPLWGIVFLKGPSCIFACHWVDFEYLQENNTNPSSNHHEEFPSDVLLNQFQDLNHGLMAFSIMFH